MGRLTACGWIWQKENKFLIWSDLLECSSVGKKNINNNILFAVDSCLNDFDLEK